MLIVLPLQKEKEDLDDISSELELADEDDKIPYVNSELSPQIWN
jgi:prefoldin subunit 4